MQTSSVVSREFGIVPEEIEREFQVDENGIGYVSLRGLSRLCGITRGTWQKNGTIFNTVIDKTLIEYGFSPDKVLTPQGIPDTSAAIVIAHYAYKGKPIAIKINNFIAAIGLRVWIQQMVARQSSPPPEPPPKPKPEAPPAIKLPQRFEGYWLYDHGSELVAKDDRREIVVPTAPDKQAAILKIHEEILISRLYRMERAALLLKGSKLVARNYQFRVDHERPSAEFQTVWNGKTIEVVPQSRPTITLKISPVWREYLIAS